MARIVSVNVGRPRKLGEQRGRVMLSAIVKGPVEGPVRVEGVNVAGDAQTDLKHHGGPEKAVYVYAREDSDWWEDILGAEIVNGMFGENLTTEGVDVSGALIGERWRMGTVELEVCQPRIPCSKLGLRFGNLKMVRAFAQASRPGAYCRIVAEGELQAGDEITVVHRPEHGVTLRLVYDAMLKDPSLAALAVSAPELGEDSRKDLMRRPQAA
jgi:MOSC domain-containing protein YiiM